MRPSSVSLALLERSLAIYVPHWVLAHAAAGTLAFCFVAVKMLPVAMRASEYVSFCQLRRLPVAK